MSDAKFKKNDEGKDKWSLLPIEIFNEIIGAFQSGANKYGEGAWKECDDWDRYYNALMRHLSAFKMGENIDADSGRHHLAHAVVNSMMILWAQMFSKNRKGLIGQSILNFESENSSNRLPSSKTIYNAVMAYSKRLEKSKEPGI